MRKILVAALALLALSAEAQMAQRLKAQSSQQADLAFATEAGELGTFSSLHDGFFKPAGPGPFPAVVLLHSCGGIRGEMKAWAEAALKAGYAVLVPDSMRGAKNNCYPPLAVSNGRRAKDALDAVTHLTKLPFIDPKRIYAVGFSQGTFIVEMISGRSIAAALGDAQAPRYAATAGLYGGCGWNAAPPRLPDRVEFLQRDGDRPLLLLMGEEDNETPSDVCLDMLPKVKESGVPVEWHIYPKATHCWDCSTLHNFSKTDFKGDRIVYRYDSAITEDSMKRTFAFFAKHGNPKP